MAHEVIEAGVLGEFPYAIVYNSGVGHNCGYLGVPPSHPWHSKQYDKVDADVHGGLTYSESSMHGHPASVAYLREKIAESERWRDEPPEASLGDLNASLKHSWAGFAEYYQRRLDQELAHDEEQDEYPIPTYGADVWWLGFDCGHYMDAKAPKWYETADPRIVEIYRKFDDRSHGTYRDEAYVKAELERLAAQASEAWQLVAHMKEDQGGILY